MKPADFYRDDNYGKDDEFVRITKTRFHRVLKGQTKNPGVDFIPKFCKIAGVSLREFYDSDKFSICISRLIIVLSLSNTLISKMNVFTYNPITI